MNLRMSEESNDCVVFRSRGTGLKVKDVSRDVAVSWRELGEYNSRSEGVKGDSDDSDNFIELSSLPRYLP